MSNEEAVRKSRLFAEKLLREMNGIPALGAVIPYQPCPFSGFHSMEKIVRRRFPYSSLEDHNDFRAWICRQTLEAAIEEYRARDS